MFHFKIQKGVVMKKVLVPLVFYGAFLFFLVPACAQEQFDTGDFRGFVNKEMKT